MNITYTLEELIKRAKDTDFVIPERMLKDDIKLAFNFNVDIQKIDLTTGEFVGLASAFDNEDTGGDEIAQGAFKKSLKLFKKEDRMPGMFFNHDMWEVQVGEWLELKETTEGLVVKGLLWVLGNVHGRAPNETAEQIRNMFLSKGPKGLSIGGQIDRSDPNNVQFEERGPKGNKRLVRIIKSIILREISPVSFPANLEARIAVAKSEGDIPTIREAETALKDLGFPAEMAKSILSKGYNETLKRDAEEPIARDVNKAFSDGQLISQLKNMNKTYGKKE